MPHYPSAFRPPLATPAPASSPASSGPRRGVSVLYGELRRPLGYWVCCGCRRMHTPSLYVVYERAA